MPGSMGILDVFCVERFFVPLVPITRLLKWNFPKISRIRGRKEGMVAAMR